MSRTRKFLLKSLSHREGSWPVCFLRNYRGNFFVLKRIGGFRKTFPMAKNSLVSYSFEDFSKGITMDKFSPPFKSCLGHFRKALSCSI